MSVIPVRVAVRCRPLVAKEITEGCQKCVSFINGSNQLVIGKDKAFTYDYVFEPESEQDEIFSGSVVKLIKDLFKGYNATILAYGQTGSGKTFTMGTNYDSSQALREQNGILPRAIELLFETIREKCNEETVTCTVSFLEIYKEDLNDLLKTSGGESLVVRDDANGGVKLPGLTEQSVTSSLDTLQWLEQGSSGRTVGATAMNAESSRSHAIFTVSLTRTNKKNPSDVTKSKFHFVDLAGSERIKKTGAEGERLKEGININRGLLSLGNVISALGEDKSHIPYRDAKLTRLLQDSLGGNSHTLMIACISPADSNMEETINTLRYADRARKIKNKPIVNRDPQTAEIMKLKQLVQDLQCQLVQIRGGRPITLINTSLESQDNDSVRSENCKLRDENHQLAAELQCVVSKNAEMCEKLMLSEISRDELILKIEQLKKQARIQIEALNSSLAATDDVTTRDQLQTMLDIQTSISQLEADVTTDLTTQQSLLTDFDVNSKTDDVSETVVDDSAVSTEHALRQAKMGRELSELNQMLERKQQLASQMAANETKIMDIKTEYETNMDNLTSEVRALQIEKDNLTSALENAKLNSASNRVSEQRRKRLKELESLMSSLQKRILEQEKTIKIQEQSVTKVGKLNTEIQDMKRQRIKLLKQLKEDSDQFRKWKQQKDKEVMQLKAKDRKRQYEMVKKDAENKNQLTVLRRRATEAAAANKRLRDALQKKKNAQEQRTEGSGIGQRVRNFLRQEIEVSESVAVAKHHLEALIAGRKMLNERLRKLRNEGCEPPSKKRSVEKESQDSPQCDMETRLLIKETDSELLLRNAQIADLQQKLMEADQEDSKSKFSPHTMVEAKCAIKYLMDNLIGSKTELSKRSSELMVEKESLGQRDVIKDELTSQVRDLQQELVVTQQEYEAKIATMLRKLEERATSCQTSTPGGRSVNLRRRTLVNQILHEDEELDHNHEFGDERKLDPDWVRTPLFQRALGRTESRINAQPETRIENKSAGCKCTSGCVVKRCRCRKASGFCSSNCRCVNCKNNPMPEQNSTVHSTTNASSSDGAPLFNIKALDSSSEADSQVSLSVSTGEESQISAETSSILEQNSQLNGTFNIDQSQSNNSLDEFENVNPNIGTKTKAKRILDDPLEGGVKGKKKLMTPRKFFDDPSMIE